MTRGSCPSTPRGARRALPAQRGTRDEARRRRRSPAPLVAASTHAPTFNGDVTLKTRSMLKKRAGRPRSAISSGGLAARAASDAAQARRSSARLPETCAAAPSAADAPARPPAKR